MKYYNAPRLIIIIEPWQTKCLLTFDAFDIIIELPSVLAPLLGSWLQARKARTASDTVWIPPCSTGPWQATRAAQRSSEAFHESTGLTWTVLPNAKDRLAQICPGKFFNLKKQVRVSQPELWTILYSIKSNDVEKLPGRIHTATSRSHPVCSFELHLDLFSQILYIPNSYQFLTAPDAAKIFRNWSRVTGSGIEARQDLQSPRTWTRSPLRASCTLVPWQVPSLDTSTKVFWCSSCKLISGPRINIRVTCSNLWWNFLSKTKDSREA